MRVAIRIGGIAARVGAQPDGLAFTVVFYAMVTTVLSSLWSRAAEASDGEIVGYSATALVWYIAASEAAIMALPQRLIETTGDDIACGAIEVELLRPARPVLPRLAIETGRVIPRLAACIAAGAVLAWMIGGAAPDGIALVLAVPALMLAAVANLAAQHAFAAAAFWVRDAKGAWFLYQKLVFLLGGMLIPLEVLPDPLRDLAMWLPFAAMAYAPARLASGHMEPELLAIQTGWVVVLTAAALGAFSRGARRLMGAPA